jgi:hypothetical protein
VSRSAFATRQFLQPEAQVAEVVRDVQVGGRARV